MDEHIYCLLLFLFKCIYYLEYYFLEKNNNWNIKLVFLWIIYCRPQKQLAIFMKLELYDHIENIPIHLLKYFQKLLVWRNLWLSLSSTRWNIGWMSMSNGIILSTSMVMSYVHVNMYIWHGTYAFIASLYCRYESTFFIPHSLF